MTPEEKLYTLMAHAEDLQSHAKTLQSRAQTAFENLPNVVWDTERRIREQATRWLLFCVVLVLVLGIVVGIGASAYIKHEVGDLRDEAQELREKIAAMQKTSAELENKTWGIELVEVDDERGIILPKGVQLVRSGKNQGGHEFIVISSTPK